jgi:ABC-type nickel/cobalt efflux system permease component RcnA
MRSAVVAAAVLLVLTGSLSAHPVPRDNHDRTILVRLTADAIEVDYRLEMDETRAALDLPRSEVAGVSSRKEFHQVVLRFLQPVLAENLDARLDGHPLEFTAVASSIEVTDHLRCDYRYRAAWKAAPGERHVFAFRDGNYSDDDFSLLRLTVGVAGGVTVLQSVAPDEKLIALVGSERKPGDGERLRKAVVTFAVADAEPRAIYKPALPPDPQPLRDGRGPVAAALSLPAPTEEVARNKPDSSQDTSSQEAAPQTLLHLLLDSRQGFAVLLLLAAGFGAAHALTPGHGKTLAAAYLVGERGTVGHAIFLGLVTTLTHTAAVLILAALLPVFFHGTAPAAVQTALELIGGLLIAGLGLWLLAVRLTGGPDHFHISGGHHGHGDAHGLAVSRPGWRGLVVLGVSGGIVPCWDALAMLALAITTQKLWLALPLLLAFSAGLASVLVVVGVAVVQARNWAGARWGKYVSFQGLERALPLASAVLVTAMGLWLCFESVQPAAR